MCRSFLQYCTDSLLHDAAICVVIFALFFSNHQISIWCLSPQVQLPPKNLVSGYLLAIGPAQCTYLNKSMQEDRTETIKFIYGCGLGRVESHWLGQFAFFQPQGVWAGNRNDTRIMLAEGTKRWNGPYKQRPSTAPRCILTERAMTTNSEADFSATGSCPVAFNPSVALEVHHWVNIYFFSLSIYFVLRNSWKGSENEHRWKACIKH